VVRAVDTAQAIYVHEAENHRREMVAAVLAAAATEAEPDVRILRMLGVRGKGERR